MNTAPMDFDAMVGQRIRAAREERELTQQNLAILLGFSDRQTLAQIESGIRKVAAAELMAFVKELNKPIEYFTDPYLIVGKGLFNWRAADATAAKNAEVVSRPLISCYKRCRDFLKDPISPFTHVLSISRQSQYMVAADLGDRVANAWKLGATPTATLSQVIEQQLQVLVLFLDYPYEVSGGACKLTEFSAIMVNRNHSKCRQAFTLAHELFHLLTWEAMTPDAQESPECTFWEKIKHVERLANNFAAGLLMPRESLEPRWKSFDGNDLRKWLIKTASEYDVSPEALYWRLFNLKLLTQRQAEKVDRTTLTDHSPIVQNEATKPKRYSRNFTKTLHKTIDRGFLSVRKAAELLQCNIEDVQGLFASYDLPSSFDL